MSLSQYSPNGSTNPKNSNRIDKLRQSIHLSLNKISPGQKLTKKEKENILNFVSNDFGFDLSKYMEKRAIKFDSEIGIQGSAWNVLHFAAKQYILKQQYRQYEEEYQKYFDKTTIQGYTAVMIAIIYESNQALNILLNLGGLNIHMVDNKKMTAYDLAINYKNQKAIRLLMNYQNHLRKSKKYIKQKLNEPCTFSKRQKGCCYKSILSIFQCLSFGFYTKLISEEAKSMNPSPRRSSILNIDIFNQQVRISSIPNQQLEYQVVWKDINFIITNPKLPLYESYNPFDIAEHNIVIKNNLILLQCLSQHTWLVRRIVQIDKIRQNHFNINLYINFQYKKLNINNQIPFIKDRQEAMFIKDNNQMWPMLLQKGLAKAHGGYFDLDEVPLHQLVQEITGFPTFQIGLNNYSNKQIFGLLEQFTQKGYYFLLEGLEGSNLSNSGKKQCFSILNFFDKGDKKLVLVNCPFVDELWKQKQKYQMYALKLIKSHINNHNQMSVWIEEDRLKQYFSKIILSTIMPNYQRQNLKAKVKNNLFFTFKVDKERQENIIFQLVNLDTKKTVQISQIRGYINQGTQKILFNQGIDKQSYTSGIYNVQNATGQYICYIDLEKHLQSPFQQTEIQSMIQSNIQKKFENHMLIMWSIDGIQPKYLDQTLGPVQFLHYLKINSIKHWNQSQVYKVDIVCNFALIIIKNVQKTQKMYISQQINKNDIIQGKYISTTTVELIKEQENSKQQTYFYCIIRNAAKYKFIKKTSYIKSSKSLDPAGMPGIGEKINFFGQ